jgi:hypothetical protein
MSAMMRNLSMRKAMRTCDLHESFGGDRLRIALQAGDKRSSAVHIARRCQMVWKWLTCNPRRGGSAAMRIEDTSSSSSRQS